MEYIGRSRCALLSLSLAGLAMALAAQASEMPQTGVEEPLAPQDSEAIQAPAVPVEPSILLNPGSILLRWLDPVAPDDKGTWFVDQGLGRDPMGLTPLEQAKLAMARQAVEASRAAGTLLVTPPEEAPPYTTEELQAIKRQAWEARMPAQLDPEVSARVGVGVHLPPVQEAGPPGLTPQEQEKLDGLVAPEQPKADTEGR